MMIKKCTLRDALFTVPPNFCTTYNEQQARNGGPPNLTCFFFAYTSPNPGGNSK